MNVFDRAVELVADVLHLLVDVCALLGFISALRRSPVADLRRNVVLYLLTLNVDVFGLSQSSLNGLHALNISAFHLVSLFGGSLRRSGNHRS